MVWLQKKTEMLWIAYPNESSSYIACAVSNTVLFQFHPFLSFEKAGNFCPQSLHIALPVLSGADCMRYAGPDLDHDRP